MSKTYRPKNRDLWSSVACLTFYLIVGAAFVGFCLLHPEYRGQANRFSAATSFGLFWGAFASLSAWEILAWSRRELTIADRRVAKRDVLGETVLHYDSVREVRWTTMHRGRIELRGRRPDGRDATLVIDLPAVDQREALEMIRVLRAGLSQAEHVGWEPFCRRYALPLRDAVNGVERPLRPDERRLSPNRSIAIFLPSLALFTILAIVAYAVTDEAKYLLSPLAILWLWPLLHFAQPRKGVVVRQRSPEERKWLRTLSWSALAGAVAIVAAAFLVPRLDLSPFGARLALGWSVGLTIAFVSGFAWLFWQLSEAQTEAETVASLGAAEEWEEGEQIVFLDRTG